LQVFLHVFLQVFLKLSWDLSLFWINNIYRTKHVYNPLYFQVSAYIFKELVSLLSCTVYTHFLSSRLFSFGSLLESYSGDELRLLRFLGDGDLLRCFFLFLESLPILKWSKI
jgi:hypothetical protein